jgi:hypothetical protein
MEFFRTARWSRAKILKEFRDLPENLEITLRSCDFYDPHNPPPRKTDAEMAEIMKGSRIVLTLG